MFAVPLVGFRRKVGAVEFLDAIDQRPADGVAGLRQGTLAARFQPRFHRLQVRRIARDVVGQDVEFQHPRTLQQALQIVGAGDRVLHRVVILVPGLENVHHLQEAGEIGELFLQVVQLGLAGFPLLGILGI